MRSANASGELTIGKMKLGVRNFSRKAGSSKMLQSLRVELGDDLGRRASGRGQPVPGAGFVARQTALGEGRHLRILPEPRRAAEAEHLERARLPRLRHQPDADDHHLDVAADEIGDRGGRAAIMHGRELGPGHAFQQDDVEVAARPDAEGSVVEFARPLLGEVDEVAERAHRQRRVHDQGLRADAQAGDRDEIIDRIVGELAVGVGRGHERRIGRDQQGVTVGCGSGDVFGAHLTGAAARLVFDHDLLAPALRQPLAESARDHVGDAAGREWHDDTNRLAGIGLRRGSGAPSERKAGRQHSRANEAPRPP